MDRNLLLAFVLSFLVLYSWSAWQESMRPPEPPPGSEQPLAEGEEPLPQVEPTGEVAEPRRADRFADLPAGEAPPPERELSRRIAAEPPDPGSLVTVDRPFYEAVLTTRGGALHSWTLKEYTDRYGDRIRLVEGPGGPGDAAATPFPGLRLGDLSGEDWRIESQDLNEIVFALDRDGVTVRKVWSFDADYGFRLRLEVENASAQSVSPRFVVDWPAQARPGNDFTEQAFSLLAGGEVEQLHIAGLGSPGFFGSLSGSKPEKFFDFGGPEAPIDWAGVQTTYFLSALLPDDPNQARVRIEVIEPSEAGTFAVYFDGVELPPGQKLVRELRGYVGPKEMPRLEAVGGGIDRSVDLGWSWFAPLTRGFVWLLHVLYSIIPNYGVAIILLTILVRVVTAPLTVKQMRSMERLRRVQPRMKEIQEKYADDRQKQSEEMMRLYRVEKVNPLGGCFPMLLQLPVFIGLFYALRSSIQLRQSPFFGWIDDLSAPESLFTIPGIELPIRVLPLIMGGTMYLQQKITPMQTPDPAQARMMLTIMPLMMTVLFYQFASGLVLYWMVSNVLAILHQLWIGRNLDKPGAARSGSPEPKAA